MSCGIYKITNKINNKTYIGQSIDIEKRWKQHIYRSSLSELEYPEKIYQAIRKYGINNFLFEIIEECSVNQLDEKELYWINFYNSYINGYNMVLYGNINNCIKANDSKKIPVIAYRLDGSLFKEYESISEASRETNTNQTLIRECLNGNIARGGNYQWMKKDDNIPSKIEPYKRKKNYGCIAVEQYDLNNNLLNTFDSILDASKATGVSRKSITRVCNGEQKSSKGFIWKRRDANGA